MIDVRRLRPLIIVVLAFITLLPSFIEMVTQGLSPIVVLARLAVALGLIGTLVWLVSGVVLYYAQIQAGSEARPDEGSEETQATSQF